MMMMFGLRERHIIKGVYPFWALQFVHFVCPISIDKSRVNTNALSVQQSN